MLGTRKAWGAQIGQHRGCDFAFSGIGQFAGIEREVAIGYILSGVMQYEKFPNIRTGPYAVQQAGPGRKGARCEVTGSVAHITESADRGAALSELRR